MGFTELTERLEAAHAKILHGEPVLCATLNDFVSALHEVFIRSDGSQTELLHQVRDVFGATTAFHLGRIIKAHVPVFSLPYRGRDCYLNNRIRCISSERGVEFQLCKKICSNFIVTLDESRCDPDGYCESPLFMAFFAVDHEVAYHLGGLFVGDDGMMASEELMRLDSSLQRFGFWIDLWRFEMAWEKEHGG
jgi:hypothetical protein